jgi:hypothetical protein
MATLGRKKCVRPLWAAQTQTANRFLKIYFAFATRRTPTRAAIFSVLLRGLLETPIFSRVIQMVITCLNWSTQIDGSAMHALVGRT